MSEVKQAVNKETKERLESLAKDSHPPVISEKRIADMEKNLEFCHINVHRLINYVQTLEQWRAMPFYPLDKDGNPLDKDGNIIDPKTGKIVTKKEDIKESPTKK